MKTAKAKMIKQALDEGLAIRGNHIVKTQGDVVVFLYRGTPITRWNQTTGEITHDNGGYDTISTKENQRKNEKAIEEYKEGSA